MSEHWTQAGPIRTNMSAEDLEKVETRSAASVADAFPLGLLGVATATFVVSTVNAHWFPMSEAYFAIPVLLIFGSIATFIAAMWCYRREDIFAATFLGVTSSFNAAYSVLLWLQHGGQLSDITSAPRVIGIAFLCFAYIGLFLMFASLRLNMTLVLMMLFLWLSFLLIGIGNLVEASGLVILGGWSGIISALFAFYAATAMVMNSVSERVVLGLGTFGEGGAASHHVA